MSEFTHERKVNVQVIQYDALFTSVTTQNTHGDLTGMNSSCGTKIETTTIDMRFKVFFTTVKTCFIKINCETNL